MIRSSLIGHMSAVRMDHSRQSARKIPAAVLAMSVARHSAALLAGGQTATGKLCFAFTEIEETGLPAAIGVGNIASGLTQSRAILQGSPHQKAVSLGP